VFDAWGFRNVYDLNFNGVAQNDHHVEITADMTLDWLARHPEHDALLLLWTTSTHDLSAPPRTRPGLDLRRAPFLDFPWAHADVLSQGRGLSYVDLALERLLASRFVADSDVVYFSDHGGDYQFYHAEAPAWWTCTPAMDTSNTLAFPFATHVPIGVRLRERPIRAPVAEASVLDWVKSAVSRHNPALDLHAWSGRDVEAMGPDDALVAMGHDRQLHPEDPAQRASDGREIGHGSARVGGRHYLWSANECAPWEGRPILRHDTMQPAEREAVRAILSELHGQGVLEYRRLDVRLVPGRGPCDVRIRAPLALDEHGAALPEAFAMPIGAWTSARTLFVPRMLGLQSAQDTFIESAPPGCAVVQVGPIRRGTGQPLGLGESGVAAFLASVGVDELRPERQAVVRVEGSKDVFRLAAGRMVVRRAGSTGASAEGSRFSSELKAAMKRWGYVQDGAKGE
jgi:hypothetical protein